PSWAASSPNPAASTVGSSAENCQATPTSPSCRCAYSTATLVFPAPPSPHRATTRSPERSPSCTAGSSRSRTLLRSVTDVPRGRSLPQRAGVDDLLGSLLAAQDHEQVGDHGGLALLGQLDDAFFVKALQGQADHADGPFDDPLPRAATPPSRPPALP